MIEKFLAQDEELEAFMTGPAGSGKTTDLKEIVLTLNKLEINYQVVAYTHKAKDILISKLPPETPISTLHSWLKKRPGVNEKAKHLKTLMTSKQYGKPAHLELLIVDEFSFVGEKDYYSIGELQDEYALEQAITVELTTCCNVPLDDSNVSCSKCHKLDPDIEEHMIGTPPKPLKVFYVGDLNQLSPVDGASAVFPREPFWIQLTHIYRTSSKIQDPLALLVEMIEGTIDMAYLEPNEDFLRGQDIDKLYINDDNDKILLSYTNKSVQYHNAVIQGYKEPKIGDTIYSSSLKKSILIEDITSYESLDYNVLLTTPSGNIDKDTKYNPLKMLGLIKEVKYYRDDESNIYPGIFGSYTNKIVRESFGKSLTIANSNNASEKVRKEAYKRYKVVNDYVSIFDFPHCMTIHKSQGSEYTNVYVDSADLAVCRDKQEMMKLLYVAMSRSKSKIFLNN